MSAFIKRTATPTKGTSKVIETVVISEGEEDVGCNSNEDVEGLKGEILLADQSIELVRKRHARGRARRREAELLLANKHAAEERLESQELKVVLEQKIRAQTRLAQVSTSSLPAALEEDGAHTRVPTRRVRIKAEHSGALTDEAYSQSGSSGDLIMTPTSSQTSTPHHQRYRSTDVDMTGTYSTGLGVQSNGRSHVIVNRKGQAGNGTELSLSRSLDDCLAQNATDKLLSLLRAVRQPKARVATPDGVSQLAAASGNSSGARVKMERRESDEIVVVKTKRKRQASARQTSAMSPDRCAWQGNHLLDEDNEPLVTWNPYESRLNGSQTTGQMRAVKRDLEDDDQSVSSSSAKRTQRRSPSSLVPSRRRIKTEDGELICWPVRMPPYIRQLTDMSLKQQFPETNFKFSRDFLTKYLGGNSYTTQSKIGVKRRESQIYDIKEYHCWSPVWNPHIPPRRGVHGASLSVDYWDGVSDRLHRRERVILEDGSEEHNNDLQVPHQTFCKRRELEYEYVGRYTQGRRYERLTQAEYDTEVPEKTRKEWAENIVRKEWGLEILIEGGMAANKAEAKEVSPARVRELMDRPDNHPGKKLRFFWRYLEFYDYDHDFYKALEAKGKETGWTTKPDNGVYAMGHQTALEVAGIADSVYAYRETGSVGEGFSSMSRTGEPSGRSTFTTTDRTRLANIVKEEDGVAAEDSDGLYNDIDQHQQFQF